MAIVLQFFTNKGLLLAQSPTPKGNFDNVMRVVRQQYVDPVNIDSIIAQVTAEYLNRPATIEAILTKLDPHSSYFPPKEYMEFRQGLSSSIKGIGIEFFIYRDTVMISRTMDGGPAQQHGLRTSDRIIRIDDSIMTGKAANFDNVIPRLIGKRGTDVNVTFLRHGDITPRQITITRDSIPITSVDAVAMLDKQTGYILISRFAQSTGTEFATALTKLKSQGMKKLILDLRENFGGLMSQAIAIADQLLPDKRLIVYTEGNKSLRENRVATPGGLFETGPLIVLVNQNTASSAEILTAGLQANKRAIVIGQRTYGKGLVQQLITLDDSLSGLKLTTARYYTADGHCIQRSYKEGTVEYLDEYAAILENGGDIPDSLAKKVTVDWGIQPDIYLSLDSSSSGKLYKLISQRDYYSEAAFRWYADNPEMFVHIKDLSAFRNTYKVPDEMLSFFRDYVSERENQLPYNVHKLKYTEASLKQLTPRIATTLKAYLAREIWNNPEMYILLTAADEQVQYALKLLKK
ncbi:MAG: S41 family peptidase [Chitinophagaceae bacterium]